ncbi:phosphogluconate dehydrogenase [Streptomyces rimosus subsp. rimosus]|nr:phosphogluconate dehydrogenase [Streptomyces rimosus subsp. rimosus]
MGSALAAQVVGAGHRVLWVPHGRSDRSRQRAENVGLTPAPSLGDALAVSDMVLSVCPPQAADEVAAAVTTQAYSGLYLDANAISPQRMARIVQALPGACTVLDGAIIGPPPNDEGRTARLYLAGPQPAVDMAEALFKGTAVHTRTTGGPLGSASALKMSFASFQKAARTLAGVAHALAEEHGVGDLLTAEAKIMPTDLLSGPDYLPSVAARAWRWGPEMNEVAETLREAGLPTAFAEAAASVMRLWEQDKDQHDQPLASVLSHLKQQT